MNYSNLFTALTSVIETETSLRVNEIPFSQRLYDFLKKVSSLFEPSDRFSFSITTDSGFEIELNEQYDDALDGSTVTIKINKSFNNDVVYFFTEKAFDLYVNGTTRISRNVIRIYTDKSFFTQGISFYGRHALWNELVLTTTSLNVIEPINLVKPLNESALNFLPIDLNDWLIKGSTRHIVNYSLPKKWVSVSSLKCLVSLSSEYFISGNVIHIFFNNPGRTELKFDNFNSFSNDKQSFEILQQIAQWVYNEGLDIETKYSLFNHQIGLIEGNDVKAIINSQKSIGEVLDNVYRNSKLAYSFHLSKIGKEVYSSLTELNKNLIDNLQKVRQNTSDLIGSLWRDFTTTFALLILNYSIKKPDVGKLYWDIAFVALIVYLIISLALTSSTSFWFLNKLKDSMTDLRNTVYSYLSDEDFDKYATKPLLNALSRYRIIFVIVLIAYIAIIIGLYFAHTQTYSTNSIKDFYFLIS